MNGSRHVALRVGLAFTAVLAIGLVERQAQHCRADEATAAEDRIRAALEATTQMEFTETPLVDELEFISSQHGIPVHLNEDALDDEGLRGHADHVSRQRPPPAVGVEPHAGAAQPGMADPR